MQNSIYRLSGQVARINEIRDKLLDGSLVAENDFDGDIFIEVQDEEEIK